MVKPKKHLGQHFLTDPAIAARIVDSLQFEPGDTVVEIGPGTGASSPWRLTTNRWSTWKSAGRY